MRLNRREWTVRDVDIAIARRRCEAHHYAKGAANTATYLHGLFRMIDAQLWDESCQGVAWWIPPTKAAAAALAGDGWPGVLALSRLVIEPGVPKNACSFLMARSMRLIDRKRWPVLVPQSLTAVQPPAGFDRNFESVCLSTSRFLVSHSQIISTFHPDAVRLSTAASSRSTLRRSFGSQYAALDLGNRPSRQSALLCWCQKQP